ncbi:phosphatidylglycerophosphatase A [Pelagibacteraceae bacterium]|jgi:phosphatidylglycerophosphatase A|nr:phosphatidylglycerophosphatase A [Pelagibacteraceae bacterium]
MVEKFNKNLFTLFGIGKLPASGTFGSFFTLLIYFILQKYFNNLTIIMLLIFVTLYSLIFLNKTIKNFKQKDPKEIVIDEYIGQMIPLIACGNNIYLILVAFISFRFFDITKIYPANIFDKKIEGPLGVIGDDIIAGIYSLMIIFIIKYNLL